VGTVYRSKDGTKPADAIGKLKSQFSGCEGSTLSEWISSQKSRSEPPQATAVRSGIPPEPTIAEYQRRLETTANEQELENVLHEIGRARFSKDQWINLSEALTGLKEKSGKAAQAAIRAHLSNRRQLRNRRENIAKVLQ
jgi:hypothetical protein